MSAYDDETDLLVYAYELADRHWPAEGTVWIAAVWQPTSRTWFWAATASGGSVYEGPARVSRLDALRAYVGAVEDACAA